MNISEAYKLPFTDYMNWCHEYCRTKATDDPIFSDVYMSSPIAVLESIWARRYWFYKCSDL
jgi:hypothetical protein